jgi:hypothetical protein
LCAIRCEKEIVTADYRRSGSGLPLALGVSKIAARLQHGTAARDTVSFMLMPVFWLQLRWQLAGFPLGVPPRSIRKPRYAMNKLRSMRVSFRYLAWPELRLPTVDHHTREADLKGVILLSSEKALIE